MNAIRQRMQYLCDLHFGGNISSFAKQLRVKAYRLRDMLDGEHSFNLPLLTRVVQMGLVNAEWLLCGTGPVRPADSLDREPSLSLPSQIVSSHACLNTVEVQYEQIRPPEVPTLAQVDYDDDSLLYARVIHRARSANMPVVLFLGHDAIAENAGPIVATMLTKGYLTGVALSSAAAMRDFERAIFGGRASQSDRLPALAELNRAAVLGAQGGMGYGEVLGRWAFPQTARREASVLATAYELALPATIHVALGDSMPHFFPAAHAAELGAALGAVSYVDMLVFADEVRQMVGAPSGVFIAADGGAQSKRLFANALAAVESNDRTRFKNDSTLISIGREYRLTFPALLTACDAVYDGSADDGRRMRRK